MWNRNQRAHRAQWHHELSWARGASPLAVPGRVRTAELRLARLQGLTQWASPLAAGLLSDSPGVCRASQLVPVTGLEQKEEGLPSASSGPSRRSGLADDVATEPEPECQWIELRSIQIQVDIWSLSS